MPARHTVESVLMGLIICEPTTYPTGCWEHSIKPKDNGYRVVCFQGRQMRLHRFVYEHFVGLVPDGLELDHLCRNRGCANFEHLEPVTRAVNTARGTLDRGAHQRNKTHCRRGHPYDEQNTRRHTGKDGCCRRHCKECSRINLRASRKRRRLNGRADQSLHTEGPSR
jgi:hypothetical protein